MHLGLGSLKDMKAAGILPEASHVALELQKETDLLRGSFRKISRIAANSFFILWENQMSEPIKESITVPMPRAIVIFASDPNVLPSIVI